MQSGGVIVPKFDLAQLPEMPDLSFESNCWSEGKWLVAGIDEAGRGALAGPVVAGAVILPPDPDIADRLNGVRDSKQMTARQRENWAARIQAMALVWGIGYASHLEVDTLGIVPATLLAAKRAMDSLTITPQHLLLDFIHLPGTVLSQTSLVKGDARSLSIAAASILAKTSRDHWLESLDEVYPGYGFRDHKGYGTKTHRLAIEQLGMCEIHRRSFQFKLVEVTLEELSEG
jgi:ribonuclease HII